METKVDIVIPDRAWLNVVKEECERQINIFSGACQSAHSLCEIGQFTKEDLEMYDNQYEAVARAVGSILLIINCINKCIKERE